MTIDACIYGSALPDDSMSLCGESSYTQRKGAWRCQSIFFLDVAVLQIAQEECRRQSLNKRVNQLQKNWIALNYIDLKEKAGSEATLQCVGEASSSFLGA